jgi:hypothetical protein
MPSNTPESDSSQESEAFKSAVRKLMQVPHHELKEKLAEADAKKDDRPTESSPDESDHSDDQA